MELLDLPDKLLERVLVALPLVDRLRAVRACRRFGRLLASWPDVSALEIRPAGRSDSIAQRREC